jgi:CubicO group peptidase (beta-lactamase class C family)
MNTNKNPNETLKAGTFSPTRLQRLDALFQRYVDRGELAGMVATIVKNGKPVYYGKFGWMEIDSQKPIQDDTIFMIASMTKPVTAVATMMFYEEGYFQLNTPVSG